MIEETFIDKKRQSEEFSSLESIDVSTRFKSSCISAIRKALNQEKTILGVGRNNDPTTLVILECASFSGIIVQDLYPNITRLEEMLTQIKGIDFIETIEDICRYMFEKNYHYMELEQDLNVIFKRNNMPFKCNNGQFIDSSEEFIYNEVTAPCLSILHDNGFKTADELLRDSFREFHEDKNKESILKCSLALDSVLDTIISDNKLQFSGNKNDFNGKINLLIDSKLISDFHNKDFGNHLKELLHSPLKIRNNEPNVSHGMTDNPLTDDNLTKFTIDMTASSILYIVRDYLENRTCEHNH